MGEFFGFLESPSCARVHGFVAAFFLTAHFCAITVARTANFLRRFFPKIHAAVILRTGHAFFARPARNVPRLTATPGSPEAIRHDDMQADCIIPNTYHRTRHRTRRRTRRADHTTRRSPGTLDTIPNRTHSERLTSPHNPRTRHVRHTG